MASLIDNPDEYFKKIQEAGTEPSEKKEETPEPAPVFESAPAPITSAGPLADVAPAAKVTYEPITEAGPVAEKAPKEKEVKKTEAPSLVANPDEYFKSIAETGDGKESKYDSADYLAAATKDVDNTTFINKYLDTVNSMDPKDINKFQKLRPDILLPRDTWKKGYDYEKSQPTQILPSKEELAGMIYSKSPEGKIGGLAGSLVNMGKGIADISAHAGFTDAPDQAKLFGDVKSFVAPALALPEEVGYTGAKMLAGGTKLTDWMLRKSDADKEENAYQRHIVDAARDQATKDSHNNIYERFLTSPTAVAGYKAILAAGGPSVEDTMATNPEMTREQAVAYRDSVLDQQAVEYGRQIANDQAPLSEGVQELGTWFTPGGLGMGEFGLLMNTSKYAKGLSKLAESKLLSKAEIGAKRAGEFESAQAKIAADIEKAQKPSLAGATAQGILDAQKKLADFAEANPKLARLGEATLEYAPAGLLGYETFGHEPGGALAGLASVAIGKKLGVGKALSAAPELVADIDKARRLAAGGKVGKYEMAGALPESSAVTRALFGGGRGAFTDKFANAVSDYAMEGVNVSAMGLATGLINSDDPEQLRQSMATGLMYGLGFKTLHKVLGKDGAADARRQKQEDVDNHMTLQSMDPESQQNMAAGADWNNVVNKSQTQLNFAETEAQIARNSGNETAIKEAEEKLRLAQTVHDKNLTANVQTRQAYGREVMKMVTEGHELLNGTMRAGQKNAGIAVLNTQQIYNKLKSRPENAGKTDAQLWETAANADGVYFHNEGSKVTDRKKAKAQEGQFEGITFDPFKPTVVVNMDKVQERMGTFGKSYYEAMSHELGHALHAVPEFREANRAAEESLFGIERVDLNGNVEVSKPGVFTPAKLLELFQTEYLGNKGYNPEDIRQWADNNGMWDATNNRYNEAKVAEYMKEEIMAGLTGANLMPSVKETGIRHVLDWASLQSQNNIVAAAINKTVGYGGKLPHEMSKDTNTGVTFTPQQLASNKAALQQLRKLNGMLSAPVAGDKSAPSISKLELLANKGLWKRYGQDSGLFKTEMRATVYDAEGKAIGSTIVADPTAKEGSWSHTPEGPKKDSGYGELPQGVTVPEGGSVRVTREIIMGADGQTPQMLTPKEAKQLQATRTGLIRDAVINAYEGEEGGFRATSADGLSFRGTFTAKQIQALRDLPENIVPKSVKDVILRMNSLVAEKAGKRMFIDYAAMMNDNGRYKAFAPKIYEIVPLSMGLSKDGNFYVVSASVTRLNDKLVAWQQRLPGRLSMWNGDRDAFFRDFSNIYLKNWQEGKPGETGLDPDPAVALQKKSIFADYLNFATKDTAELHDRTTIPRKRGDARDKDMDRIVMSVRADHVRDMMESTNDPLPIDYQKGKFNLLPSKKGLEEGNRSGIDSSVDEYIRNYKYDNQLTPAHGFRAFRDTPEGASKLKEDRLLGGLVDSLREAHRISEQADEVSAQQAGASEGVTTPAIALRDAEIKAVKEFAVKNGILKDFDAFTREYLSVPAGKEPVRGAEHDVIIGDPVTKRSGAGLNHNYLHYLDRMIAHSLAFPESEPKLSGIQVNPRGGSIYIETKQPYLPDTGERVSEEAKRAHMLDRGFYPVSPSSRDATSFYNPETGMHVDDLHDGNIIETPGADGNPQIVVIDPQIRHTTAGRWDTEIRQDVFRNNPELQDRMQDSSALPAARVPKENVRKAPVGRMGFDVANMEEVPQFGAAIEKAKSVLAKPENMPTQFKPSAKLDEAHASAIESGDMEEAQRLVDERAREAGYGIKAYHGTDAERFNVFDLDKSGENTGQGDLGDGFYFASTPDFASEFGGSVFPVALKDGKYAVNKDLNSNDVQLAIDDGMGFTSVEEVLKNKGFDGIQFDRGNNRKELVVWDNNNIKSADPATYDDKGKLIPLSQRFDTTKPDIRFKPSKKVEGAEEIESAPGFQKALTKGGKWAVYGSDNLLATGKQFDTPEAADQAAKVIATANEPLQGIPYSLQEGRTGKWKILDKKGEAAASKTFSDPTEAADYAVALHRESMPLAAVKKFMIKADRDAVTEAEQRIADMQAKNPEAMPLVVARDGDTGLPKIDLLEDAEGNPVLDEKGKQARGVIYRQVPYRLRQSPMIDAKDDNVAVQQAADLMTPEVQTAMADPSVAKAIGWYKQMRKQLQQYYGANIELFGQLLGATSARTPVDENFKQTIEAARQYSKGAYDALLQRFHEHIVQATEDLASGALQERWEKKNPAKTWNQEKDGADALRMEINKFDEVPVRSNGKKFNANSQKVLHALYGNWLSQTVGPKTPNFAGNLTGRTLRATIDVWAARNLRRLLYDDGTSQWRLLPEQEKGVDSAYNAKGELTGDFPFAQNVYDEVASRVNMNADDLQASMWFYEKGIWDQNGWTGALGAKKSSFEEEAEKLSLDRYQAGVTAYTHEGEYPNREEFTAGVQEKTRKELRDSIGQLPGVEISRVTHTDGLYGGSVEPSLDVEFSVSRDKDGKPQSIASVIDKLKNIGKEQNQYDTFISQVVDKQHPNARPMVEVGFKNAAKPEEVDAVVKAFRDAGIDGFTLAKDTKGNVIGIRAQYIPEISSRWDEGGREDLLDHEKHGDLSQNWADKARQAVNSLGDQENVSYKNEGYVSTHVYGKEEYDKETSPQDLLGSNVRDQLGRRKRVLEAPTGEGQVSSGDSPD